MATSNIYTEADLATFRDLVNAGTVNQDAELMGNITLTAANWTPIGTAVNKYNGDFDGNNFTISGLVITGTDDYRGLFGYTDTSCTINNISVINCDVSCGSHGGALVGRNYGAISNCYASGVVVADSFYVGGLTGINYGAISVCAANVIVSGDNYTGGLIAYNNTASTLTDCYSIGAVTGTDDYTGGLCGRNKTAILDCHSVGAVTGVTNVGGLVGQDDGTVTTSYYNSTTSGRSDTGRGSPLTTSEYTTKTNFTGFDFAAKWYMDQTMPKLQALDSRPNIKRTTGGGRYVGLNRYTGECRYNKEGNR